jgi:iron(III) transport system substrate-binding protein
MTKKVLFLLLGLSLTGLAFGTGGSEASGKTKAAAGGQSVEFYANITGVNSLMKDFTAKSGIKANYTRISSTKILSTDFTEFDAGKLMADVIQAPMPVMDQLAAHGVLAKYTPPAAAGYPAWAKAEENKGITQFGIEYVAIVYNTKLVKPADVPTSYKDLADPKWKNKIVMADPSIHPSTISWLVALKDNAFNGNEAQWLAFLKGLAANKPMFVKSFGPTPAPIESGEKAIGISMPKYIITKAPAPLAYAQINPIMGSPRGIGISSKAPHMEAAKKFMDYWLGKDAAGLLASKVGEYVVAPGVYPPVPGIDKLKVIPIKELSDQDLAKYAAQFKTIFGIK